VSDFRTTTFGRIISVLLDDWYDVELGTFETDDYGWFEFRIKMVHSDDPMLRGDIIAGPLTAIRAVQVASESD